MHPTSGIRILATLSVLLLSTSCSVKWIADYDSQLANEIVLAAQKVDAYYADLISITSDDGTTTFNSDLSEDSFKKRYKEIDTDLYGVMLKNQSKALNKFSTEISKSILEKFWRKYEGDLGTKKALLEIHRSNFTRNFEALLKAETTKNNSGSDN